MNKDDKNGLRLLVVKWATAYEDAHPEDDQVANTEALRAIHTIIDRQPIVVTSDQVRSLAKQIREIIADDTGAVDRLAYFLGQTFRGLGHEVKEEG